MCFGLCLCHDLKNASCQLFYFVRRLQAVDDRVNIIKIAMIRVNQALRSEHLRSRLVLQVHDELLIETAKEEVEEVSAILEREMRQAADLSVPLEVDMHTGENWYEAK